MKNGLCEIHFLTEEISKGKKCRLKKGTIPSQNIVSKTEKFDQIIKTNFPTEDDSFKAVCSVKDIIVTEDREPLHPISIELFVPSKDCVKAGPSSEESPKVFHSLCCICGTYGSDEDNLVSIISSTKLLKFLKEILNESEHDKLQVSFACANCESNIMEAIELKITWLSKVKDIRHQFTKTKLLCSDNSDIIPCIEVNENEENNSYIASSDLNECFSTYECPVCEKAFESSESLLVHKSLNHTEKELKPVKKKRCRKCRNWFKLPEFQVHFESCSKSSCVCNQCGRMIMSRARLKLHMFSVHNIGKAPDRNFKCKLCPKSFSSKNGLKFHEQTVHKSTEPIICEVCQKEFYHRSLYISHKLHAHGEKKVVCDQCGEKFFSLAKLNNHTNSVHLKVSSWSCHLCFMKFGTSSALNYHRIMKHENRKHTCDICKAKFRRRSCLRFHLWKHSIYKCIGCKLSFQKSEDLRQHMFSQHKDSLSKNVLAKLQLLVKKPPSTEIQTSIEPVAHCSTKIPAESTAVTPPTVPTTPMKNPMSHVVINDILIASNAFDNSLSNIFPKETKPEELAIPFESSLEIQSIVHESIVDSNLLATIPDTSQNELILNESKIEVTEPPTGLQLEDNLVHSDKEWQLPNPLEEH